MSGRRGGGYSSEFEEPSSSSGSKRKSSSWRNDSISEKVKIARVDHGASRPARSSYIEEYEKEERKSHFAKFLSLNAYQRHQKLVGDYLRYYGGKPEHFKRDSSKDKTDYDVLRENHKFIWDDEEETGDWGKQMAKRYYDKLFKEYCICDLSCYKENKFAMRWRVEKEVTSGKGQFVCGARKCENKDTLKSWEVNFGYLEHGEKKNALVKLRLCPDCSYKLNYHKKHKKAKKKKSKKKVSKERRREKKERKKSSKKKKKRNYSTSSSESGSDESASSDDEEQSKNSSTSKEKDEDEEEDVSNIWKKPVKEDVEKTREEEFDEYLDDLFM